MTAETITEPSGPYAHADWSVRQIMLRVMAALVPATVFNAWVFGWPAVFLFAVTVAAALIAEAICLWLAGRPVGASLADGSAALTAWLLAFSLPPYAPWWIGMVGAVIAIVIGKHIFGGLGQNLFNPAMVARVALLISFPVPMTLYVLPTGFGLLAAPPGFLDGLVITFGGQGIPDALSAATALSAVQTQLGLGQPATVAVASAVAPWRMAAGTMAGSLGETSALLLAAGGVYLLWARVITWHVPVALAGSMALLSGLANAIDPARFPGADFTLLTGATVLGAFFIATDPVTSPVTRGGQLVFGAGCGLLSWVIRSFAGYPEGLAFAILLMNAATPLIDRGMRPRVHGRTRHGRPLTLERLR